jgi:hypothetical protein
MKRLLFVLFLVSCEGDPGTDAPAKCRDFLDVMCNKLRECFNDGTTQAECLQAAGTAIDYGAAVAVSSSYDRCMSEFRQISCSVLLADPQSPSIPASCVDAIKVTAN